MSLNNAQIFSEDNILLMSLHIISELRYHLHFISFTKVNILKIIFIFYMNIYLLRILPNQKNWK